MEPVRLEFLGLRFDALSTDTVAATVSARRPGDRFAYIVTPNVDHINRLYASPERLRALYDDAWLCLCDSRILLMLAKLGGQALALAPGSDLTARMFNDVIKPNDSICIIGGQPDEIEAFAQARSLYHVAHHQPPMGFVNDPEEIRKCVEFVASHPSRYVFFAVGSPQQEIVAHAVFQSNRAVGVGFCIGASIDFLTGKTARAPVWMQKSGLEWLHRLAQNPKRMFGRYIVQGPKVFGIFLRWWWRKR